MSKILLFFFMLFLEIDGFGSGINSHITEYEKVLQSALEESPSYVTSFFNAIFSAALPPESEEEIVSLDQALAKGHLEKWFDEKFGNPYSFYNTHAQEISKIIPHITKNMQGQILFLLQDALINLNWRSPNKENLAKILSFWPDQKRLYGTMDEKIELLSRNCHLGIDGCTILAGVLGNSPDQSIQKTSISFLKEEKKHLDHINQKYGKSSYTALLLSIFRINVPEIHEFGKEVIRSTTSDFWDLMEPLNVLLQSSSAEDRVFARQQIHVFLSKAVHEYEKIQPLLMLATTAEREEAIVQLKKILQESQNKAQTVKSILFGHQDLEIVHMSLNVWKEWFFGDQSSFDQKKSEFQWIMNNLRTLITTNPSFSREIVSLTEEILQSPKYSEKDKIEIVKILIESGSVPPQYLKTPLLLQYQEQVTIDYPFVMALHGTKVNAIYAQFIEQLTRADLDKHDLLNRSFPIANALSLKEEISTEEKFAMIHALAAIDFKDVIIDHMITSTIQEPSNVYAGKFLAQAFFGIYGFVFPPSRKDQEQVEQFVRYHVDMLMSSPSAINHTFVVHLLQMRNIPHEFSSPLKQKLLHSPLLNQEALIELLCDFLKQPDVTLQQQGIEFTKEFLRKFDLENFTFLIQSLNSFMPETLRNEIGIYIQDLVGIMSHQAKTILKQPFSKNKEKAEQQKKDKQKAQKDLREISKLLILFTASVPDITIKTQLQDLEFRFGSEDMYMFLPKNRLDLLQDFYRQTSSDSEKKAIALKAVKQLLSQSHLPILMRDQILMFYLGAITKSYDTTFSDILGKMLDFQNNLSGGHAMTENVHDKKALSLTNTLLSKLLEDEDNARKTLTSLYQDVMLIDIENILQDLPLEIKGTLEAAALINSKEDYIEAAKKRIQIMRLAKRDENKTDYHWYGTASENEIVVKDHPDAEGVRHPITVGRALQLVYDAMNKHPRESVHYKDSLTSFVEILGTDDAMNGCREGAIGGLIRSALPTYTADKTAVSEKFDIQEHGLPLKQNLSKLKSLMLAMLDQWRINRRIFDKPLDYKDYPMLNSEFMDSITKENHVIHEFFKILGKLGWDSILADLKGKSLYQLFIEGPQSPEEEEIINDVDTLLIAPATHAFIYGEHKSFLANGSLNLGDYIHPVIIHYLEVLPMDKESHSQRAARRIQQTVRKGLMKKPS